MTLHDESLLTAYLDGELDPDQRSTIATALGADPELAEHLRRLAAVRDLVAGLPRPVLPADLTGVIGERIVRRRQVAGALLGGLGLAASVLIALGVTFHNRWAARPPVRVAGAAGVASRPLIATDTTSPPAAPEPATASGLAAKSAPAERPPENAEEAAADRAREAELIREMLDSPHLRRIFIVTDVIGGTARDRVEELVQKTPRTEATYGRITVSQGIVIDPRHPNEATVFALVMNEQELRHFQTKLERSFPDRVEDNGADPAMVTQLSEIGQIAVLPGTRASEVVIPGDVTPRVALRTDPGRHATPLETSRLAPAFGLPDLPGAGGGVEGTGDRAPVVTAAAPRQDEPPDTADPTSPLAKALATAPRLRERPAIVLVWVTSS